MRSVSAAESDPLEQDLLSDLPRASRLLAGLFVASGFSAVGYQVILSRYLQLVTGSTAYAVSAILVAFMLGTAVGSALGGRLADRSTRPLRVYAVAEGVIGLYCALVPLLYPLLLEVYLDLAPPIGPGFTAARNGLRFAIGFIAFVFPSVMIGITTPAFARAITAGRRDIGPQLARLYGWNTLGAAAGALVTAYVLVPLWGLDGSLFFGSAINLTVALVAFRVATPVALAPESSTPDSIARSGGPPSAALLLLTAFGSGFLSFALEVLWTHLLAILIGNSVYAFGLMLSAMLLGLTIGTLAARRLAVSVASAADWVGLSLALAGLTVAGTLSLWDGVPLVFLQLARSSPSFALMESVRFLVAFGLMLAPMVCFGISFPLMLRAFVPGGTALGSHVGTLYAVNTAGAVCGTLGAAYALLPGFGSLTSLKLVAGALMILGGIATLRLASYRGRGLAALSSALVGVVSVFQPVWWDFNSLNMAAAIYLGSSATTEGHLIFSREDATGGLTTVIESRGVRTLLTNGKFQGDDSEEIPIQHRLANIPTLFTAERERALVVGLGTGVTLAALAAHGFREVVCAEISAPIIDAAGTFFRGVNGNILAAPALNLVREDGRSVLLERPDRYDVISVEVTTIWFAGVGPLYSEEFYRLASRRLKRNGVMLQWFPVHHLSARNLYVVVNTMRAAFRYVSLWSHRHQGFVVGSNEPLRIDLESVRADLERDGMRPYLRELASGSPLELFSDLVVADTDIDGFLDAMARLLHADRSLVSTDTWPTLEYETPKDILEDFSYFQNRAVFQRFRSARPFPFRGEPTLQERLLVDAAFSRGWSDPRALARLSGAWSGLEGSGSVARWLMDELAAEGTASAGHDAEPIVELRDHHAALQDFVSTLADGSVCEPYPVVTDAATVRLSIENVIGISAGRTQPAAMIDGLVSPEWTLGGWLVRAAGRSPRVDLRLDRSRRLESIHVAVSPVDGSVVRTRVMGLDEQGRWRPLASGGSSSDLGCRGVRVYRLGPKPPSLVGLRIEAEGEALADRIAIHEIWAVERRGSA